MTKNEPLSNIRDYSNKLSMVMLFVTSSRLYAFSCTPKAETMVIKTFLRVLVVSLS